jgi:acyl-CoA dehydrogenase
MGSLPRPLPPGVPEEEEYVAEYCDIRGISRPQPAAWAFYVALSMFRAASILAGVYARSKLGNASSANAARMGAPSVVRDIAATALRLLQATSSTQLLEDSPGVVSATPRPPAAQPKLMLDTHAMRPSPRCEQLLTRLQAFMAQHVAVADVEFATHVHGPNRWQPFPMMESLKGAAKAENLWNLWISPDLAQKLDPLLESAQLPRQQAAMLRGPGLSNLDYAYLAREMGPVPWSSEVFNCSAPDTGNMEVRAVRTCCVLAHAPCCRPHVMSRHVMPFALVWTDTRFGMQVLARYGNLSQQQHWLLPLLRGDIRSCFAMTEAAVASSDATNIQGASVLASIILEWWLYRLDQTRLHIIPSWRRSEAAWLMSQ